MKVKQYIQSISQNSLSEINRQIAEVCGIADFFSEMSELDYCDLFFRENKYEFGDWQTNCDLTNSIVQKIKTDLSPQVVIEPTCGKGNFILSVLDAFDTVTDIYAVEIYKPYLQQLKHEILQRYLDGRYVHKVNIHLVHGNVFDINWSKIGVSVRNKNVLVIGNPPWITNSSLGRIESDNLPKKFNIKHFSGIASMTGKGNFDIAEYICLQMIENFAQSNTTFALLLKNSVIRQLCYSMPKLHLPISALSQHQIDAKKEFGASVDASLFTFHSGEGEACCDVYDFYTHQFRYQYGWVNGKFVSDTRAYKKTEYIDGLSPIIWRSGIKHDCQPVLELIKEGDTYYNKLGERVTIEDTFVYPYVKSSDIQSCNMAEHNRFVIVPQRNINDNTETLLHSAPLTYDYLLSHKDCFEQRKSTIYKNRPTFSIFGIGEYTFKPYKIIISSLYKSKKFVLFSPINGKCVIPDDTCYMVGFDRHEDALNALEILENPIVSEFMQSISFNDSKRVVTKDLLMRINLHRVDTVKRVFALDQQQSLIFDE